MGDTTIYNLKDKLIDVSNEIKDIIENQNGVNIIETPEYGWENYRYESSKFRLAHVERYFNDGLLVVHITVFPHENDATPIFGFDVIGSEKTGKVTGVFIDYSPTLCEIDFHEKQEWIEQRTLPQWADIFSSQFIAVRPHFEEYDTVLDFAVTLFKQYIDIINSGKYVVNNGLDVDKVKSAQNRYCERQSKNERTFGALKTKIGDVEARYFMENILFPKIK